MRKRVLLTLLLVGVVLSLQAQQYGGLTGMVHIPTAEMNEQGTARIGANFLNGHLLPDSYSTSGKTDQGEKRRIFGRQSDNRKYITGGFYLNITPFKWIELSYNFVLMKRLHYGSASGDKNATYEGDGLSEKDQFFSVKLRPLAEKDGKWWPSLAIGGTDFFDSHGGDEKYFGNIWLVATKTFKMGNAGKGGYRHELAPTLGYRYFFDEDNKNWRGDNYVRGVFAGVSYRPAFYHPLRFTLEWTGHEAIIGADCLLWNHWLVQASLANGKYPSAGLAYQINLLGLRKKNKTKN